SGVDLSVPNLGLGRSVSAARLLFSDGSSVLARVAPGTTTATFTPRTSTFLRIEIAGVTGGSAQNGVGFSDIAVPGLVMRRVVQAPMDLQSTAARSTTGMWLLQASPLSYVFERARAGSSPAFSEERDIGRLFDVPSTRSFTVRGMAHLDPRVSDQAIDSLIGGGSPVQATSSSRLLDNPVLRASAALDGDASTAWVPATGVGAWLRVSFPSRLLGQLSMLAQNVPGRSPVTEVRVSFSDGSSVSGRVNAKTGKLDMRFRPRRTSQVTVTVTGVAFAGVGPAPPVGIAEIGIPGVR